ncbi:hypothetical protein BH23PLA1_BH23PLA1_23300 [soil metagenome]
MSRTSRISGSCGVTPRIMSLLILLTFSTPVLAQQPAPEDDNWASPFKRGVYRGAAECKQCHAQPVKEYLDRGVLDWCLMTEFSTWRAMDKHSMAYAVLEGPRGQKMGELLGAPGQPVNVAESPACLSCHALDVPQDRIVPEVYNKADGINCEVCHGPSGGPGNWYDPHSQASWREKTPEEKATFNFVDLRVPDVKVRLCLSCHVGDPELGRVVTHPMYAAGHPPLPSIDVAAFAKNEPQHWRDQDNVPYFDRAPENVKDALGIREGKLYQTEVSMASGLLSLSQSMKLLTNRANFNAAQPEDLSTWPELSLNPRLNGDPRLKNQADLPEMLQSRWPEIAMTHMDCTACHHDLRLPGWRAQRGYKITPGRPVPRDWSSPMIDLAIDLYGEAQDRSDFDRQLAALYYAFDARPFGQPTLVRNAAEGLQTWVDGFYKRVMESAAFDEAEGRSMMAGLCNLALSEIPDYDTARQIGASLSVIYRDWAVQTGQSTEDEDPILQILDGWETSLNLGRYPHSNERDRLSFRVLKELGDNEDLDFEAFGAWTPRAMGPRATPSEFFEVSFQNPILRMIRADLSSREAYVTGDFKSELQRINNLGIQESLEIASAFDPRTFQDQVQQLRRLLPAP